VERAQVVGTAEVEKSVPHCHRDLKAGKRSGTRGVWCMELWMDDDAVVIMRPIPQFELGFELCYGIT
jgi:hypothetical protein